MPDQATAGPAIGEVQMLANGIQYSIHGATRRMNNFVRVPWMGRSQKPTGASCPVCRVPEEAHQGAADRFQRS